MLVLLIVCLMKLIEMYTNNNKMARNKCARNAAKENNFGLQNVNKKFGMPDDDSQVQKNAGGDRYAMNYFYDVDQSCVDQLKEYLHHKTGNDLFTEAVIITRLIENSASEFHRTRRPWSQILQSKVIGSQTLFFLSMSVCKNKINVFDLVVRPKVIIDALALLMMISKNIN